MRGLDMAEKATPMTKDGIERVEKELEHLRAVRRPEVADRIHQAKELASAQNNAEYEEAKNEQAFVEGRIMTLEHLLQNVTVIDEEAAHKASRVQLGSKVSANASDGKTMEYTIVGAAEARPTEGMISNESPVGRALLGKRVGDEVQVSVPRGVVKFTITSIS
jgi:transcription elongation factor GreA